MPRYVVEQMDYDMYEIVDQTNGAAIIHFTKREDAEKYATALNDGNRIDVI